MATAISDNIQTTQVHLEQLQRSGGLSFSELKNIILNPTDRSVSSYVPAQSHFVELRSPVFHDFNDSDIGYLIFVTEISHVMRQDAFDMISRMPHVWVCCPPNIADTVKTKFPSANVIHQYEFVALTPDNKIIDDTERTYCCGTADAVVSLSVCESFREFVECGGKNIYYIDVTLSLCIPDRCLINRHIEDDSNVSASVTDSIYSEDRSVLCEVDGIPQLLESFLFHRKPESFDLVHTGHIIFKTSLQFDRIVWNWHRRNVVVRGNVDVHYKRYIYDLTEAYDTKFIKVDRDVYTLP